MSLVQMTNRIIDAAQAYVRTDVRYLLSGGFWLTLGQVISSLAAFLIAVVYANVLSQDVYGVYKYIIAAAGLLTTFSFTGMNVSIIRSSARGLGGSWTSGTVWRIYGGLIGSAASLVAAVYYYIQGNVTLALGMLIVASLLPLFDAFTTASAYMQGKRDFKTDAWYSNFIRIGSAAIIISAIYFTRDVVVLLLVHFASYTILRGIVYWKIHSKLQKEPVDLSLVAYGRHLSYMNVLHFAAIQIDKILLFQLVGAVELAIYSVATAIPEHIRGLVRNLEFLAAPKFAQLEGPDVRNMLRELWRKMFLFATILSIGIIAYYFFAPLFFTLVFPQYTESIPYSQIFAVTILLNILVLPAALLRYQARTKELYAMNIASDVVQIILLVTLIWLYGIWGAVWARIIGVAISGGISIFFVKRAFSGEPAA